MTEEMNDERYGKKCIDCIFRDRHYTENPCDLCYKNEALLGWHYYWEPIKSK